VATMIDRRRGWSEVTVFGGEGNDTAVIGSE
jgi:hypothetical protein